MQLKEKVNEIIFILIQLCSTFFFLFFLFKQHYFEATQALMLFISLHLILFVQVIFKIKLNLLICIIYETFLILHFVLGEIFSFYIYFKYYDIFLHFFSSFFICILAYSLLNEFFKEKYIFMQLFFSCLIGLICEYFWELIEYTIDDLFLTNMQRYMKNGLVFLGHQALSDTMKDMFIAIFGCLFFIIVFQNKRMQKIKLKGKSSSCLK